MVLFYFSFGFFITLYYFIKFLLKSNSFLRPPLIYFYKDRDLILAGVAFGIAQLLKFSNIILIPIFILIAFMYYLINFKKNGFDWIEHYHLARVTGNFILRLIKKFIS